jgi:hypothetical protein
MGELDVHMPAKMQHEGGGGGNSPPYPLIFHVHHDGGWDSGEKSNPSTPIGYWLKIMNMLSFLFNTLSQVRVLPGGVTIFELLDDDAQDAWEYVK